MAEGKKSFVLYSDQRELFDQLTDEYAGKLIKHIYSYVNDENPISDDIIIKISFTPIKLQLKRDLKKWELQQDQRKEAGRKSAENRKRALTESNERSISSTVNVNGNVNGNVNDIIKADDKITNEVFIELSKSERWIEVMCINHKCNIDELIEHLRKFYWHCLSNDYFKEDSSKAKKHFNNWINKGNPIPKIKHSDFKGFD